MILQEEEEKPSLQPVQEGERIAAIDVLRGFAILGILAMNIYAFAMPFAAYMNPLSFGGATGINFGTWVFTHIFFDLKFMAIFSMLFGAGLVLLDQRAEARGVRFLGVYYRRLFWLLAIALLHSYLLWYGDILFFYAVTGVILYPLRRWSPRRLSILGCLSLLVVPVLNVGFGFGLGYLRQEAARAERKLEAGEKPSRNQEEIRQAWTEVRNFLAPGPEAVEKDVKIYQGSYGEILKARIPMTLAGQTWGFFMFFFWRACGLMFIGMALMKLGVLSAGRSRAFYWTCALVGLGIGIPLSAYGTSVQAAHEFDLVAFYLFDCNYNYVGSVATSLAYVSIVLLISKSGILAGFRERLAAVGRMALTNYLLQTAICTTLFYGYGFGLYGRVERFAQMGIVVAIWILQLVVSPIWLRHFRFGPAEWLWRTLTYLSWQPMGAIKTTRC